MKTKKFLIHIIISCIFVFIFSEKASAAINKIDESFGSNGIQLINNTPGGTGDMESYDTKYQSDGKLLVVGYSDTTKHSIWRLKQDGSIDTTFASEGLLEINYPSIVNNKDITIELLNDDSFYAAINVRSTGETYMKIIITKFSKDGVIDSTYNNIGYSELKLENNDNYIVDMTIQNANQLLVFSQEYPSARIFRLNANGTIDNTFDTNGLVDLPINTFLFYGQSARKIEVDKENNIYVLLNVAVKLKYGNSDVALFKLDQNGLIDTSFANSGFKLLAVPGYSSGHHWSNGFIIDNADKIVLTADISLPGIGYILLWKLDLNGNIDTNFAANGYIQFTRDTQYKYLGHGGIRQYYDNNYIISAYTYGQWGFEPTLFKINQDGTPDESFTDGVCTILGFSGGCISNSIMQISNDPWIDDYLNWDNLSIYKDKIAFSGQHLDNASEIDDIGVYVYEHSFQIANLLPDLDVFDSSGNSVVNGTEWGVVDGDILTLKSASGLPIAEFPAIFFKDLDWSNLDADSSIIEKKSFLYNFTLVEGIDANVTFSLYIPKDQDDNLLTICPGATSLTDVEINCQNKITYQFGSPNLQIVTENGQQYWKISGLTGTGGISHFTVLSKTGSDISIVYSILIFTLATAILQFIKSRSQTLIKFLKKSND